MIIWNSWNKQNTFPENSEKIWYKNGMYIPLDSCLHSEYILDEYLSMGFSEEWKNNLMDKYGVSDWDDLKWKDKDGYCGLPLDDEYSSMESEMLEDTLSLGWNRIWNNEYGEFTIECKDIMKHKDDIRKIITDSYYKDNCFVYDYDSGITIHGNSDEILDSMNGKSGGEVYKNINGKYKYYSTLREGLRDEDIQ